MIASLLFVGSMAVIVVILDHLQITDPTEPQLAYIFVGMFGLQVTAVAFFTIYCVQARKIEVQKLSMTRHQVDIAEYERLNGQVDAKDEFLVHSFINKVVESTHPGSKDTRRVFDGVLRKNIYPSSAAGWLFDEDDMVHDDKRIGKVKPHINYVKAPVPHLYDGHGVTRTSNPMSLGL